MRVEVIKCDVCGAEKHSANNWWMARIVPQVNPPGILFLCTSWRPGLSTGIKDVCGRECAQKLYERFMGHGTLDMMEEKTPEPAKATDVRTIIHRNGAVFIGSRLLGGKP